MRIINEIKSILNSFKDYEYYREKTLKSFEGMFTENYTKLKIERVEKSGCNIKVSDIEDDLVKEAWKQTISTKLCDPNLFFKVEFIEEFACYVDWDNMCRTRDLSESFLEKFSEFLNMKIVFAYQSLSGSFINKHKSRIKTSKKDMSWLFDEEVHSGTMCGPVEIYPSENEYITFNSEDIEDSPYFISCDPASESSSLLIVEKEDKQDLTEEGVFTIQNVADFGVINGDHGEISLNYDVIDNTLNNYINITEGDINLNGTSLVDFINNINERLNNIESNL